MFPVKSLAVLSVSFLFVFGSPSLRAQTELLLNGNFKAGTQPWQLDRINGAEALFNIEPIEDGKKAAHIEVSQAAEQPFHVQLFQGKLNVNAGETYHLSFRAKGKPGAEIGLNLMVAEAPWTNLWKQSVTLTPEWQDYAFDITPSASTGNARVTFTRLAALPGEYWFADVSLTH